MVNSPSGSEETTHLLLVEDNPGDVRLVEEAVAESGYTIELEIASSKDEALDFVYRRNEYSTARRPDLILLDWHLKGTTGEELLTELKNDRHLKHIPVIVVTASQHERDILKAYNTRANACVPKPGSLEELIDAFRVFERFWIEDALLPDPDDAESEIGASD